MSAPVRTGRALALKRLDDRLVQRDAALKAAIAGKMGVAPTQVPDVVTLLLRPVAQGQTVDLT